MSITGRTLKVLKEWAGIDTIHPAVTTICEVWGLGEAGKSVQCADAIPDLIRDLKAEFPEVSIKLLPKDLEKGGARTMSGLIDYVAGLGK